MTTFWVATPRHHHTLKNSGNMGYLPHTYCDVKGGWVGWEKKTVQQQRTCGMIWHLKLSCKSRCPCTNPPAIDPLLTLRETAGQQSCFTFSLQYLSKVSWQSRLETRFSILEIFKNRVSRLEFWVSIFEDRELGFEDRVRVSSFKEFSRSQTEIWQNDLILENNTIAMNKTIDAWLYSCKLALKCMQIFFLVVHFLQDTCGLLIYTELITLWQQTNLALMCIYNFSCQSEWFFCTTLQPKICFSLQNLPDIQEI